MSYFDSYPPGLVPVFAILQICLQENFAPDRMLVFRAPFRISSYTDLFQWRTYSTVFDLPLDSITFTSHTLSDLAPMLLAVFTGIGSNLYGARFFRDPSRSFHHSVDDHLRIAVTVRCLTFVTHRTFPLPPSLICISRLKIHPWLMRRRKRIPRRGISRMNPKLSRQFGSEGTPSRSVQLLSSLYLALFYLPALLHSAVHSPELVALAKSWGSRKYLHHLLPLESVWAEEAVEKYLLRVGGNYWYLLDLRLLSRY